MRRKHLQGLLIALALVAVFGCGERYAEVESSTSWSGNFDGTSLDGRGDARVDMGDEQCAVVQKETRAGDLRVRIVNEGGLLIFWDSTTDWKSTSADYGVVTICADD